HQIPIDPTPDTLSLYIVYMCHFVKPNSVRSYLSGICNKLEPIFPNIRQARSHSLVTRTLQGCIKLHAVTTHRKQPLTRSSLIQLHAIYSLSLEHDDILFFAMILTGFHGLLRLGELAWPDKIEHRDYRKVIMRHTVSISSVAFEFLLPTHKADKLFEGNRVIIQSIALRDDPLLPFKRYLTSRDTLFRLRPELWLRKNGSLPTRGWLIRYLRKHFPAESNISGHSIRAGGATALAEVGIPLHIIQ
ncbi:hypothetical protein M422DRAFT_100298, partial [Sphaerobolus stellatus SS14]